MTTNLLDLLTPDTRAAAVAFQAAAAQAGLAFVVGSTLRTCAQQGLNTAPIMVNGLPLKRAPGCRSFHTWGRAFDVTLVTDPSIDRYTQLGALAKSMGLQWGGDFKTNFDPIHFQLSAGLDLTKLCPDPTQCDAALAAFAAGLPPPGPAPAPASIPSSSVSSLLAFAFGASIGFFAMRWVG